MSSVSAFALTGEVLLICAFVWLLLSFLLKKSEESYETNKRSSSAIVKGFVNLHDSDVKIAKLVLVDDTNERVYESRRRFYNEEDMSLYSVGSKVDVFVSNCRYLGFRTVLVNFADDVSKDTENLIKIFKITGIALVLVSMLFFSISMLLRFGVIAL